MTKRNGKASYEVGFGKPPQHSQFQRGQSGNPRGRPKGATGFDAALIRELEAKIIVTEGGARTTMSKGEAAAKRLVEKALKGDMPALRYVAETDRNFAEKVESRIKLAQGEGTSVVTESGDEEILRHFSEQARNGNWSAEPESGEV
ncbi:MAG: hypothetical protein JWS10_3075 [Cypionkella sp.]|uniref:DUF5681 domain-containing protein n=1 Tax=Cypionkella sp. TaxID=2811411 RepID=UPI0026118445|nr:DUF5681 domain-containing protein [Cypionkella sp.]MDB5660460.1 hypothetical protein [Cypionkella sp.]